MLSESRLGCFAVATIIVGSFAQPVGAQANSRPLLQLEVSDSVGLPLPDAKLEVFTFVGTPFWDWISAEPQALGEGTHLLRFSAPGYRPSMFSVLLRDDHRVALRVSLYDEADTSRRSPSLDANQVHATGFTKQGTVQSEVVGVRRVIDRAGIERAHAVTVYELLRSTKGIELSGLSRGTGGCTVTVNGDRRRVMPFAVFNQMFTPEEAEAFEVVQKVGMRAPTVRTVRAEKGCRVLMAWLRKP
jgi:hypothetical protein